MKKITVLRSKKKDINRGPGCGPSSGSKCTQTRCSAQRAAQKAWPQGSTTFCFCFLRAGGSRELQVLSRILLVLHCSCSLHRERHCVVESELDREDST